MHSLHKVKQYLVIYKIWSRSGSELILAWRSWRIHASISSARGHLAPPHNAESDIVREKMRGKQTRTWLGTRPPVYYDFNGTYRYIPPGHTNKCSQSHVGLDCICLIMQPNPIPPTHFYFLIWCPITKMLKKPCWPIQLVAWVMAWCLFGTKWSPQPILKILILRNKLQWNLNQNIKFFIPKHSAENTVCKMPTVDETASHDQVAHKIGRLYISLLF